MIFSWGERAVSICRECRVHFEPYLDGQPYEDYCQPHRQPLLDRNNRYQKVMAWAKTNWEILEPQMIEDEKKINKTLTNTNDELVRYLRHQAAMQRQTRPGGTTGGIFP